MTGKVNSAKMELDWRYKMFEVIVWDYDAAPDAESQYFVAKRKRMNDSIESRNEARYFVEEKGYVGAAVFCEFDKIAGFGLTFDHPEAHLIPDVKAEEIQDDAEQNLALEKKLSKWR